LKNREQISRTGITINKTQETVHKETALQVKAETEAETTKKEAEEVPTE